MFKKQKTIEAASFLLRELDARREGIPYIKLIKLLYIADREMLRRKRRTLTGDQHWSMKFGPVLGNTLSLIKGGDPDWDRQFQTDLDAKVILEQAPSGTHELSRADLEVLTFVVGEFGHMPWSQLVELTHTFPEWKETKRGRSEIHLWTMAKAVGFTDDEAKAIAEYNVEINDIQMFQDEIQVLGVSA